MHLTDRRLLLFAALSAGASAACADPLTDLIGKAGGLSGQSGKGQALSAPSGLGALSGLPGNVTTREGQDGLRQALTKGAIAAVTHVGRLDGYWADGEIRIPLPGTLGSLQKTLKGVGLSGPLDDLHLRVNRAAETAAPRARTLFTRAISTMTIDDVAGVLRGGDTAGTQYLKGRTGAQLETLFHPPMKQALEGSGAMKAFRSVSAQQGLDRFMGSDPADSLTRFAVAKGLDGLFHYVGVEEAAIRRDPVKQTTGLLKKVFGAL